jgi:GNAT superfamily N-acetyltransferase
MRRFRELTLKDKEEINHILEKAPWMEGYLSSELVFENLFVWRALEPIQIGWFDQWALLKCVLSGKTAYLPPVCDAAHKFIQALTWIRDNDPKASVIGLTGNMIALANQPGVLLLKDDFYSEYIYRPIDLIQLAGANYRRKRNLVHQFGQYESRLMDYVSSDRPAVTDLLERYLHQGGSDNDHEALLFALDHILDLDLFCDLLWVEDKVVALSVGCRSIFGHGIVLFEKADVDFAGSYAAIIQKATEKRFADVAYLSRQEDIGIPELRKAKNAYHPIRKERKMVALFDPVMLGLYELYRMSFDDSVDYVDYFFLRQARLDRTSVVVKDQQVVSGLHLVTKTMRFNHQDWDCPFVVGAATHPDYRHQGFMRDVMKQTFERLYQEGTALVSLYPVDQKIYTSFEFVPYVFSQPLTTRKESVECSLEQTVSAEKLRTIYDETMANQEGYIVRDLAFWHEHMNRLAQDGHDFYLMNAGKETMGYVAFKEDAVEEVLVKTPVLPVIKGLDISPVNYPSDTGKPENMIRIVSLHAFLKKYQPPVASEGVYQIRFTDQWIESNNTTLQINVANGTLQVSPCKQADFVLSIGEFTKLVFTGDGLDALATLFPKRHCVCFDRY